MERLYSGRHLAQEEVQTILESQAEGRSLRGASRISGRAYGTGVSLVSAASQKAPMMHNQAVKPIETSQVSGDELGSFVEKNSSEASLQQANPGTAGSQSV